MKQVKTLALFATVALGAMSCSNNEIIETLNEQNEIRFASVQMGNSIISRAATETLAGTETFGVYAYLTSPSEKTWINAAKLSKSGDAWGLNQMYYYPVGTFSMDFWAYGKDFEKNKPDSVSAAGMVYTDYTIDQTKAADHEAFVISKDKVNVTQAEKANGIALHFWHALCKIQFTAKITNTTNFANVDAKITSISISTSKTGSITYEGSTSKWTPGTETEVEITVTKTSALTDTSSAVTNSFYAIPLAKDADKNTITVTADLYHKGTGVNIADQITGTIEATGAQLAINNSVTYNIILDLSKATGLAEIKFAEPTIENWKAVAGGESTFPKQQP